jgi:hypothetical protein
MNIKQHIEAGHYPKDEKGRAIVPTTDPNEEAVIAATDAPGQWVLMGWVRQKAGPDMSQASWWPTGAKGSHASIPLLPPAPRKLTRYLGIHPGCPAGYATEAELREKMAQYTGWVVGKIEYEENW